MSDEREERDPLAPYTDLAVEATAALRGEAQREIPGVRMEEYHPSDDITVTWVEVLDGRGVAAVGKLPGNYATVEAPGLRRRNRDLQEAVGRALVEQLHRMLGLSETASVLVVGLGNWNATPDALGPRVVNQLMVTRHLKDYVPEEVAGGIRPVAAISPGVLGLTGLETAEVVLGIVERMKPDAVIAIDALAARSIERIGTTVQVADTGINPGSGIGNKRVGLTRETLGCPVIAIGCPTVVHAATIVGDTLDLMIERMQGKKPFLFSALEPNERRELVREALQGASGELVVTPKEVDELIEDMSKVIAGSLNAVLHTSVHARDLMKYLM
jgi:spore protease